MIEVLEREGTTRVEVQVEVDGISAGKAIFLASARDIGAHGFHLVSPFRLPAGTACRFEWLQAFHGRRLPVHGLIVSIDAADMTVRWQAPELFGSSSLNPETWTSPSPDLTRAFGSSGSMNPGLLP